MEDLHLYQQIAESIRQEILSGDLKPGDRLPPIRKMTSRWNCTTGTVQRAYQELSRQGLITSRAGRGTSVVENLPSMEETPLRRAELIHRAEEFLLQTLTAGYSPTEIESALRQAMDRWRSVKNDHPPPPPNALRFSGSHDLVIAWLGSNFSSIVPGFSLQISFTGSLGGLIDLAEGEAELAGCHLWDHESDTYNLPFVHRLFPGQKMAILTLAQRRLGLIFPNGNPRHIASLQDLARSDIRFANRQTGSGTRVWLDNNLREAGISPEEVNGYHNEKLTHLEIALAVAEGEIDVGFGLQAAADNYGLDFLPLTLEQYDLVIPSDVTHSPAVMRLREWLSSSSTKQEIRKFAGYDVTKTGKMSWSE